MFIDRSYDKRESFWCKKLRNNEIVLPREITYSERSLGWKLLKSGIDSDWKITKNKSSNVKNYDIIVL